LEESNLTKTEILLNDHELFIEKITFENGCFIAIAEDQKRLGTIALAMPSLEGRTPLITQVYGSVNDLAARLLAEN